LRCCDDDIRERLIKLAERGIRFSRAFLDDAERVDERPNQPLRKVKTSANLSLFPARYPLQVLAHTAMQEKPG